MRRAARDAACGDASPSPPFDTSRTGPGRNKNGPSCNANHAPLATLPNVTALAWNALLCLHNTIGETSPPYGARADDPAPNDIGPQLRASHGLGANDLPRLPATAGRPRKQREALVAAQPLHAVPMQELARPRSAD